MARDPLQELRPAANAEALASALAAARKELAQAKPDSWRRDLAILTAVVSGIAVGVVGVLGALGQWAVSSPLARWETLSLLALLQLVGVAAAMAPRARWAQVATVVMGVAAMAAVVALRGAGAPSALPPWVCTLSHLGVGLAPVATVVVLLRHAAISPLRALAAGICVGTPGAIVGELGCGQSAAHVALFHLPAWGIAIAVCMAVALRIRPRSYAP
jgi:hypothetical protein